MNTTQRHITPSQFILSFASEGRYTFTFDEALEKLGRSTQAVSAFLRRLKAKGEIVSPHHKFFVIVAPEYRSIGCLPAKQFVPALMEFLDQDYYTGLLSAAELHGAAHQRSQVFQVMVAKNRTPIKCSKVEIIFVARKHINQVKTENVSTPRGYLKVSTPEFTAIDLVGYADHSVGLDNVATVLAELAEKIRPKLLVEAAKSAPITWGQRLGYLLCSVGQKELTGELNKYVSKVSYNVVPLSPHYPITGAARDKDWNLAINVNIEPDI